MVDQIADLFHTTHKVKTQQVTRSRGQRCGDIELAGYLANVAGPVSLVLDLLIARFGSSSDLSINEHLHYPNDVDKSIHEAVADKIRQYRVDYSPSIELKIFFLKKKKVRHSYISILFRSRFISS